MGGNKAGNAATTCAEGRIMNAIFQEIVIEKGMASLPDITWQQGCTPRIDLVVKLNGIPQHPSGAVRPILVWGESATCDTFYTAGYTVPTSHSYRFCLPTMSNSTFSHATGRVEAWWIALYFYSGIFDAKYFVAAGKLFILPSTFSFSGR